MKLEKFLGLAKKEGLEIETKEVDISDDAGFRYVYGIFSVEGNKGNKEIFLDEQIVVKRGFGEKIIVDELNNKIVILKERR